MTLTINPRFKALIPPLAPEEYAGLESSISNGGCRDALITWNGTLVDGHNRYEICQRHKVPFKTVALEFMDESAACIWIIDNQMSRRNLADIDRIDLQQKLRGIIESLAKANQKKSEGRGKKGKAKLPNLNTRETLAKAAGVGERTFDAGVKVLEAVKNGDLPKEDLEAIRRKEKSIHRVAKDLKEKLQRDGRAKTRLQSAASVAINSQIIVADFRQASDKIANGSVSLIFTDPPYDREASKMLPALAEFASNKLADGGSLICYVGQTQIPAAIDAFRLHLKYLWIIACLYSGNKTIMREYGIKCGWKAVLWFTKGSRDDISIMVSDVMSGGEEKSHHDWQQSQSEAEYWIEKLCPKDGIVCDPFLGGGTTAAAAKKLGRKWIGFEIDEESARIASGRVAA